MLNHTLAPLRLMFGGLLLAIAQLANAQVSAFQYTGTLSDAQQPSPSGSFDFQIGLYSGSGAGASLLAPVQLHSAVPVQSGYFTLDLDFGNAVLAAESWLQIGVRPAGTGSFDTLSPRQKIGHVPLAYFAEITDWSGIANVPGPVAKLAARPPGIGDLVANALGDLASLRIRAIEFGVSRTCIPTCSNPVFEDIELLVEPGKDWWKLFKWLSTSEGGNPLMADDISVAIHLDATGGLVANPMVTLQGAQVTRVKYESATGAGDQDLVRVRFHYAKLTSTIGSTGVSYTYNRAEMSGTAVPGACPDFFSTLAAGVPATGVPSSTLFVLPPQNPIDADFPMGSSHTYEPPILRFPLDPAVPNRWARAVTCAFALATTNTALVPDPTLTFNTVANPRPDDHAHRMTWKTAKMVGMRVESDAEGALATTFSIFGECVGLSVNQGVPGSFGSFGWNYKLAQPCMP